LWTAFTSRKGALSVASVASTSKVCTYCIMVRLGVGNWKVEGSEALNDPSP
jgi:hypothetical protein